MCFLIVEEPPSKFYATTARGFWICQKRLSQGRFKWWPKKGCDTTLTLDAHELQMLLWNGNPFNTQTAPMWRKIPA
nr:transposase [Desulfobacula toluolica]